MINDTLNDYNNATDSALIDVATCTGHAGIMSCKNGIQCYSINDVCQYDISERRIISHCADGTHLSGPNVCRHVVCPQRYKCLISCCIPLHKVCDDMIDCPNGDDELRCDNITCPGQVRCSGSTHCVIHQELCDGHAHCPEHDDEMYCQQCLQQCKCTGNMIQCHNANQSVMYAAIITSPAALVLHNSASLLHYLTTNYMFILQQVYNLDVHGDDVFLSLKNFPALRWLSITYSHVSELLDISCPHLTKLNLSNNNIYSIARGAFSQTLNLKTIILTSNCMVAIKAYVSEHLQNLETLYLNDNPLGDIDTGVFLQNSHFVRIRSDWYMVCCVAATVKDCQPQGSFVSSCASLFSNTAQKFIIVVQGTIATLANSVSLVYRVFYHNSIQADKVLMVSLTGADLLMGLYLSLLAGVDFYTDGSFHLIISQWTKSYTCVSASFVNFVSSRVSDNIGNIINSSVVMYYNCWWLEECQ